MKRKIALLLTLLMVINICSPLLEAYALTNQEFIESKPYKGDLTDKELLMKKVTPDKVMDEVMAYLLSKGYKNYRELR